MLCLTISSLYIAQLTSSKRIWAIRKTAKIFPHFSMISCKICRRWRANDRKSWFQLKKYIYNSILNMWGFFCWFFKEIKIFIPATDCCPLNLTYLFSLYNCPAQTSESEQQISTVCVILYLLILMLYQISVNFKCFNNNYSSFWEPIWCSS